MVSFNNINFMKKKLDEVTQNELESLYLENNLDVKKIAEKTGWINTKIGLKFSSFYNTENEIGMLLGQMSELIFRSRKIALAPQLTRADSDF